MPYIKPEKRQHLDLELKSLLKKLCDKGFSWDAGTQNYLFTSLCSAYIKWNGEDYQNYNDLIGALEGAKLEIYRRWVAPYEETKRKKNGDVE
jgi:hypothetical protein